MCTSGSTTQQLRWKALRITWDWARNRKCHNFCIELDPPPCTMWRLQPGNQWRALFRRSQVAMSFYRRIAVSRRDSVCVQELKPNRQDIGASRLTQNMSMNRLSASWERNSANPTQIGSRHAQNIVLRFAQIAGEQVMKACTCVSPEC